MTKSKKEIMVNFRRKVMISIFFITIIYWVSNIIANTQHIPSTDIVCNFRDEQLHLPVNLQSPYYKILLNISVEYSMTKVPFNSFYIEKNQFLFSSDYIVYNNGLLSITDLLRLYPLCQFIAGLLLHVFLYLKYITKHFENITYCILFFLYYTGLWMITLRVDNSFHLPFTITIFIIAILSEIVLMYIRYIKDSIIPSIIYIIIVIVCCILFLSLKDKNIAIAFEYILVYALLSSSILDIYDNQ
jgi:hypothetical protein